MASANQVFHGMWWNHLTEIWTLTISERQGGVLSAMLVVLVGFASSSAWQAIKFILHQHRATLEARDGMHHHHQLALKNSATHLHMICLAGSIFCRWRHPLGFRAALSRSLGIMLLPLFSFAVWSAVPVFISFIWTTVGNDALLLPRYCGIEQALVGGEKLIYKHLQHLDALKQLYAIASTIESQCYRGSWTDACYDLETRLVHWTEKNISCPLRDAGLCIDTTASTPFTFDSGFVSSSHHLGINAPFEERVQYRKAISCSPISAKYVSVYHNGVEKFRDFYYGPSQDDPFTYRFQTSLFDLGEYRVESKLYDPHNRFPEHSWKANATIIDHDDAIVAFFFIIQGSLNQLHPTDDPVFAFPPGLEGTSSDMTSGAVNIIGCIEEQEICNPEPPARCARFTPMTPTAEIVKDLELNGPQRATASRIIGAASNHTLYTTSWMVPQPLLASAKFNAGYQIGLIPSDQWRLEIKRWSAVSMLGIQLHLLAQVRDPSLAEQTVQVDSSELRRSCAAQVTRSASGIRNFDLAAIVVVVVVSLFIIVLGLSVDVAVGWLQNRTAFGREKRQRWLRDGVFHQNRLAYAAAGFQRWGDSDSEIPTTAGREEFPPADRVCNTMHMQLLGNSSEGSACSDDKSWEM